MNLLVTTKAKKKPESELKSYRNKWSTSIYKRIPRRLLPDFELRKIITLNLVSLKAAVCKTLFTFIFLVNCPDFVFCFNIVY